MFSTIHKIRVRYGETDRMGYVYYGNYPEYLEVARVEMLRDLGLSYRKMEDNGIMLPVYELDIKYIKPAFYDDLLTIKTEIRTLPDSKITFYYEIENENGELLTKATTTLVFVDVLKQKPTKAPEILLSKLRNYY